MEDNNKRPGQGNNSSRTPRKGPRFNIYWIYGIILLALIGLQIFGGNFSEDVKNISFQEFKSQYLAKGNVEKLVVVNKREVEVYLKKGTQSTTEEKRGPFPKETGAEPAIAFNIGSVESFKKRYKSVVCL